MTAIRGFAGERRSKTMPKRPVPMRRGGDPAPRPKETPVHRKFTFIFPYDVVELFSPRKGSETGVGETEGRKGDYQQPQGVS